MQATPKGLRLHIGLFGRRNVGKSSLLNAMVREQVSIVSDHAGTTTDPVEKPMELLPLGPVCFIDTAGIDDQGDLGNLRIQKTRQIFERTDVAVIITEAGLWGEFECRLADEFRAKAIPVIVVANKTDLYPGSPAAIQGQIDSAPPVIATAAMASRGLDTLRQALIDVTPDDFINSPGIIGDRVPHAGHGPGDPKHPRTGRQRNFYRTVHRQKGRKRRLLYPDRNRCRADVHRI